jgi:hypothetical protein
MLLRVSLPRWVFTASVESHAKRCLAALGIDDVFEGIIDCRFVSALTMSELKSSDLAAPCELQGGVAPNRF